MREVAPKILEHAILVRRAAGPRACGHNSALFDARGSASRNVGAVLRSDTFRRQRRAGRVRPEARRLDAAEPRSNLPPIVPMH